MPAAIFSAAQNIGPGSVFGFSVMWQGGKSMTSWTGQRLVCGNEEVLKTSWLLMSRVDDCLDKWKSTLIGQNTFTRTPQSVISQETAGWRSRSSPDGVSYGLSSMRFLNCCLLHHHHHLHVILYAFLFVFLVVFLTCILSFYYSFHPAVSCCCPPPLPLSLPSRHRHSLSSPLLHCFSSFCIFFFLLYLLFASIPLPNYFTKLSCHHQYFSLLSPLFQPITFPSVSKSLDSIPFAYFFHFSYLNRPSSTFVTSCYRRPASFVFLILLLAGDVEITPDPPPSPPPPLPLSILISSSAPQSPLILTNLLFSTNFSSIVPLMS